MLGVEKVFSLFFMLELSFLTPHARATVVMQNKQNVLEEIFWASNVLSVETAPSLRVFKIARRELFHTHRICMRKCLGFPVIV